MAKAIATLATSLTARTANFEKGFKKASRIVTRFGSDLYRHTRVIAGYGAAIIGVAAGATAYLVKQQLEAVDATSKLSRTLGLTTEELSGYQYAIKLAGGDSEGVNKSIIRMNRTIADAQAGLSTAVREINRAGLSLKDFAGLSTDQRIKMLADRYNSIGDAAGRASFLMTIFGRSGAAMGNLFEQGAEGIAKAQKEAEALGLTFGDIDGRQIEAANDAVLRLQEVITGVARRIAIQLAPYIQVLSDRMLAFAMNSNSTGNVVVNVLSQITKVAGKLADYFSLLKGAWYTFVAGVQSTAVLLLSPIKLGTEAVNKFLRLLGVEPKETAFDAVFDGFTQAAAESADKARELLSDFANGVNSKKAESFFQGIQIEAKKAADAIAMSVPKLSDAASADVATKTAQFTQVMDLNRVSIGGSSKIMVTPGEKSIVEQQKISNNYLSTIAKRGTSGAILT